jgi:hypothetical protein
LLNLQRVEGFDICLTEIRSDKIETGLAKLIVARMLHFRGIPFKFVVPSKRRGKDYDAEATVAGTRVPIEMKAKVEGKDLSPGAIAASLARARKQLPKDSPNLVFLRVPDTWGLTEPNRQQITVDILDALRDSQRLAAVVVHWERCSASC